MAGAVVERVTGFYLPSSGGEPAVPLPSDFDKRVIELVGQIIDMWMWAEAGQTQGSGEPLAVRDAAVYGRMIEGRPGSTVSIASVSGHLNGKPAFVFDGTSDGLLETLWSPTESYFCVFALRVTDAPAEMRFMGQSGNSGLTRSDFRIHQSSAEGQKVAQSGAIKAITGAGNTAQNGTDHIGWFSYNAADDTIRGGWDNVAAELSDTIPNAIDPINTVWRFGGSGSSANFFNGKLGSVLFLNQHLHGSTENDDLRAQLVSEVGTYYGVTVAGSVTSGAIPPADALGDGVPEALANAANAGGGLPVLTSYALLPTALTRTIDARNFGVVGDPVTTARASLTDNTEKLQDIITYVKSLTPTSGLSSIQAEVPIMTIVDLPPGYVGVTASTLAWEEPDTFVPGAIISNYVAVLLDCDNIVFRGNGTTIVQKDPGALDGYVYPFGTGYERALVCGSNPIKVWNGLRRCFIICTTAHRLAPGDIVKIGGSMTTSRGVTFSALAGYQTVAAYPVTATTFYFFYDDSFAEATSEGTIGGSTLTFTALRSVSNIGFIGDLTFNVSQPGSVSAPGGVFLNGANDVYFDAQFRSDVLNASVTFAGHGVRAYNCKRLRFSDRCSWNTMAQGIGMSYCSDVAIGDVSFWNVNEGIDVQLACWKMTFGAMRFKFDPIFQPVDTTRSQERQAVDISDSREVYIESIISDNYHEPLFIYPKNLWGTYPEFLDNAGTLENLSPPGVRDICVNNVIATNDDGYSSDHRMGLFGWHQESTLNLTPAANPFTTTNGSSTVTYTNTVAHRVQVGDQVIFSGTISSVGGLTSGNISGGRTVLAVPTPTTFTFTAGASATSGATGGGSAVAAQMPNHGVGDVPEPKNVRIGSYTSRGGGYVIIEAGDISFGNLVLDATPGTGAALRIGSQTVTDPVSGSVTKHGSVSIGRLAISNCDVGLTITGTPTVRFGDVVIPSTVTTPMSSISIAAKLDQSSIRLGPIDVVAATVDEPLLAIGANEGAFVVQGWLSNVGAISAGGSDYATAQLVKVSSGAVATIGGTAVSYGSGAINAGVMTALNGNGADADGLIGPDNVVAVRFTKQGAGKAYPSLSAKLSAIRWRTG